MMKIDKKVFWETTKQIAIGFGLICLGLLTASIMFLTYQVIKLLYF